MRSGAMLLGILLHALIPYMAMPVPHLLWAVREPQSLSAGFDAVYWLIHGFRVQLFFIIAGIFAAKTLRNRSVREFLVKRLQRLGVPLIIGTITIVFPLMYLIWAWGWVRMGLALPRHILHVRFQHGMQQDLYGFAHLWFLYYLLIFSIITSVIAWCVQSLRLSRWFINRAILSGLVGLVGAAPIVILHYTPRVVTEFHHWFVPHPIDLSYYGCYYIVGLIIGAARVHQTPRIPQAVEFIAPFLGSGLLFAIYFSRLVTSVGMPLHDSAFAVALSLYTLLMYVGCLNLCKYFASKRSRGVEVIAGLAPLALWLYITHPPLVGLVQVLLYKLAFPAWGKAVVAALFAFVLGVIMFRPACSLYAIVRQRVGVWQ